MRKSAPASTRTPIYDRSRPHDGNGRHEELAQGFEERVFGLASVAVDAIALGDSEGVRTEEWIAIEGELVLGNAAAFEVPVVGWLWGIDIGRVRNI